MFQKNLVDTINISKSDCDILKSLLIKNKHSDAGIFLNQRSQSIYQVIGELIWNRQLPTHILNQSDKYDSLICGHFTPLNVQRYWKTNLIKNIPNILSRKNY